MSGQRTCVAKRIQDLEPGQSTTFLKPRIECDSERHAEARRRVDAMSTSHEDIKLIKYSPQKEDIFRRIKENIGLQWHNRCSNHGPYQMDDKGRRPW